MSDDQSTEARNARSLERIANALERIAEALYTRDGETEGEASVADVLQTIEQYGTGTGSG